MEIAHLTSAHRRYDNRIFLKECRSLAAAGHRVTLVVADGGEDETVDGVRIISTPKPQGRLNRFVRASWAVVRAAEQISPDAYHLHDPELLPYARRLARGGAKVYFDAHEDLPAQLLSKSYIPSFARKPASLAAQVLERGAARHLTGVFTATPFIRDKFLKQGVASIDINNYPSLDEAVSLLPWENKEAACCYVGTISEKRGLLPLIQSLSVSRSCSTLHLVGTFSGRGLRTEASSLPGWSNVREWGHLNRAEVQQILRRSIAGIVTFLPEPNHVNAQPNKMFEYMAAGIPIVASDFPLWRSIIQGADCGLCVNPSDPEAIAKAIDYLVQNPGEAQRMGMNGRSAILSTYNWDQEKLKLILAYQEGMGSPECM